MRMMDGVVAVVGCGWYTRIIPDVRGAGSGFGGGGRGRPSALTLERAPLPTGACGRQRPADPINRPTPVTQWLQVMDLGGVGRHALPRFGPLVARYGAGWGAAVGCGCRGGPVVFYRGGAAGFPSLGTEVSVRYPRTSSRRGGMVTGTTVSFRPTDVAIVRTMPPPLII